ncbi:MAG TPA: flagellar motor switch protein FliG [Acidimicrobiales bacterium]|nr:flagellar motor switch protein FliG [Acidimicrobiales bacterium]
MNAVLTMAQKAAVVLVQLDDSRANLVLRNMSEAEVTLLMQEVARLPTMTESVVAAVIGELGETTESLLQVRQGGLDAAARLLRDRLGNARAEEILADLDRIAIDHPLAFMNQIDPLQVIGYIAEEHPQTIAIIIAHLEPDNAARLMERLADQLRAEVARRVAKMAALPPSVVLKVAAELESRLSSFVRGGGVATQEVGGIQRMVGILNNTDRATEKQILADLEGKDPEIAEAIRHEMFVFDDLLALTDPDLQLILRSVPVKTIALSLKGKDPSIIERFKTNLSERNAMDLQEDFETLGAQRQSLVEHAEAELIRQARSLAEAGDINIERGDDELVA